MVNLMDSNIIHDETDCNSKQSIEECNNLIWTLNIAAYMNIETQENASRVHVLCCNKCDFLTISFKSLQQHMTQLHSIPDEEFNNLEIYCCHECKCVSTEFKLIKEHIKIFHNTSMENSNRPSKSEKVTKKPTILTTSVPRNTRKITQSTVLKTQMKIRKNLLRRKSLKKRLKNLFINGENIAENNNDIYDTKKQSHNADQVQKSNNKIDTVQNVDENDPLDMSMNSTTCQFKSIKCESMDCNDNSYSWKQESGVTESYDKLPNNSINNSPLLSNPQTCIELIKLTLNQMLNKNSEQNRLSHLGFNPTAFLQPQFQISPNIIPLLLPTTNQNPLQNDISFISKNSDLEAILNNIQQQNLLKSISQKSFEQGHHMLTYQQSPLFINPKMTVASSNVTASLFVDSIQKNGNFNISPSSTYKSKKTADCQNSKIVTKRSLKKQPAPTKIRNGHNDELDYLQTTKFESPKNEITANENLFNRSFLDSSEIDVTLDHVDMSKNREDNDNLDAQTNISNKSSPHTNDKPHRQNFTSQQNRILSDWFFTHCDKPYPSTEDTKELSQLSGLTYSQVKKWFANKRARSSLNKKNHKSYCLNNPTDSTLEEFGATELQSISPSSDSEKSYNNHNAPPSAIDFTNHNHEEIAPHEN